MTRAVVTPGLKPLLKEREDPTRNSESCRNSITLNNPARSATGPATTSRPSWRIRARRARPGLQVQLQVRLHLKKIRPPGPGRGRDPPAPLTWRRPGPNPRPLPARVGSLRRPGSAARGRAGETGLEELQTCRRWICKMYL